MVPYDRDAGRGEAPWDAAPWSEYRRLVFKMLEDLAHDIEKLEKETRRDLRDMEKKQEEQRDKMVVLAKVQNTQQFKLNVWHTLAAAIPALITVIMYILFSKHWN